MKKIFILFILFIFSFSGAYAQESSIGGSKQEKTISTLSIDSSNFLGVNDNDLREGNVDINTIPKVLASIANTIIIFSGVISIFMLIFFAFRMQVNSGITGDSSGVDRAKKGMIASAVGFVISISAWFVMARIIDVLVMLSGGSNN